MRLIAAAAMTASLALAGCANDPTPREVANAWSVGSANPLAPPVSCVPLSRIRMTSGRDDRTIDFEMDDGRVLRNRLPNACPGLAFEDRFLYRTSLDRLCSTDAITLLTPDNRTGPTCGLGMFQEVAIPPRSSQPGG